MSQHDYVIANGTGAAVRSDLNNALAAIVSQNSGATAPTPTYAYQWWADTTTGLLKLRNAANNAWITLFQLDGEWTTLAVENGSAAAPSIYFKDSGTDTGFYSPGADQVGISTGGTARFEVSTTAATSTLPVVHPLGAVGTPSITFTGDLNTGIWSPAADTIAFSEGGVEAMRIDSSGRLGIGTNSASKTLHVYSSSYTFPARIETNGTGSGIELKDGTTGANAPTVGAIGDNFYVTTNNSERFRCDSSGRLLVGTSTSNGSFDSSIQIAGNASLGTLLVSRFNNNGGGPVLYLAKSRSGTVGTNTIVQSGDELGTVSFLGANGSGYDAGASIQAFVDGTPGASNDMPTRLVFSTTANGASSPTERMKISENGAIAAAGFYDYTTATAANMNIAADYFVRRSTSSSKYKTDIETLQDSYADALLGCRPVWYRSTCKGDNPDHGWWGFIAEEVAEIDPRLVHWKTTEAVVQENGSIEHIPCDPEPEGVQYDRFVPHLLNLIKRQQHAIETLEAKVAALEAA